MADDLPPQAPRGLVELVVGRYLLYGALASGGMATVHLGRLTGPGGFSRFVAIKRLHDHYAHQPQFVSSLLDEARLSARIWHPNVVPTLDIVSTDDQLILVMEYVQGESLARLLRAAAAKAARVPLPVAIAVIAGALHGLHAAHEASDESGSALHIVHRDVSPQNIMVGVDGVPRVLDFGVAKAVGRLQQTDAGQLKGKLAYMAPEQFRSQPVDRRTDVFAASAVLWELLAGKRLFAAENEGATLENLLFRRIDPPSAHAPDIPPKLDNVVLRGLSRNPAGRYLTAHDMAIALEELVHPATASQIAEWVQSLAEEALADRARRVREIESTASDSRDADSPKIATATISGPYTVTDALAPSLPPEPRSSRPHLPLAELIAARLIPYLGPHTSKVAVKTFTQKALGRGPETLTPSDVPMLLASLRPMLRTFIGRTQCEQVLAEIARGVG